MCVRVEYSSHSSEPWDHTRGVITLPPALPPEQTMTVVRALLAELAVEQPEFGARCYCGDEVKLLPRVPEQRRNNEVMRHGA
jgi:hypothetical protein